MYLARRLALCLNPHFNIGVHEKALKVYEQVFHNMSLEGDNWAEDLGAFCMGLLPFLKYCSVQIKPEILNLIDKHLLPLGSQLSITLPALIPSILLMYEENDESIRNKSLLLVDKIIGIVGSKYVYGCIYMGLLRYPSYRTALLRYINTTRKKKNNVVSKNDQLSIIHSMEDDGDNGTEAGQRIYSIKHSIMNKPLIAGSVES